MEKKNVLMGDCATLSQNIIADTFQQKKPKSRTVNWKVTYQLAYWKQVL